MSLVAIVALIAFVFAVPVPVLSQLCLGVKIDKPTYLLTVLLTNSPDNV